MGCACSPPRPGAPPGLQLLPAGLGAGTRHAGPPASLLQPPTAHLGWCLHRPMKHSGHIPRGNIVLTQVPLPPARTCRLGVQTPAHTPTPLFPYLCLPARPSFTTHMPMQTKPITCPNQIKNPAPRPIAACPHSRAYTRATRILPSCSLTSTPQPKTSLYPPTQDPLWPILALPPCAPASLASLAPSLPCSRNTPSLH
jgi:hypothetical protein